MNGQNGVYFVPRRSARKRKRYGAGILIVVLLLLTAGICALAVMLPKITDVGAPPVQTGFSGRSFYVLSTGECDELTEARLLAKDTADRGGAGYLFNDGKYRVVAAVYSREADAKLLSGVNENSYYFELKLPAVVGVGDSKALEYFAGEWFETVANAAGDLERGKITEAAAEFAVTSAVNKLSVAACSCETPAIGSAMTPFEPVGTTVLNRIRYIQARAVADVYFALCALRTAE